MVTIYSDNHNTSLATLGNTLNITITTNEDLSSAKYHNPRCHVYNEH